MKPRQVLPGVMVIAPFAVFLSACTAPGPKMPIPVIFGTPLPTATPTATPSPTPSPTPTPMPAQVVSVGERELHNGDWDAAGQAFQRVLSDPAADPDSRSSAQLGLAEVSLRNGDFPGAKTALDAFLGQYPNNPRAAQAYFLRGDARMGLGDWQGAISDFNGYLALRPGLLDSYIHERIGDAYLASGQDDLAVQNYEQSTAGGRDPIALLQLREHVALRERAMANSLLNAGQAQQADGIFKTALGQYQIILSVAQIPSYRATIEYAIAQTLYESGQKQAAYDQYNHVFETYPASPEALEALRMLLDTDRDIDQYERGIVNFNQGQYQIAVAAFISYRAATPPGQYTPQSFIYLAKSYHALGNLQAALTELQVFFSRVKPETAGPSLGDAWLEMASIYADEKDTGNAFKTYEQFVSEHPDMPQAADALFEAASLAESTGDYDRALGYYQRLGTQFPDDSRAADGIFRLGLDSYRKGDLTKAETLFQDAAQTPGNSRPAESQFWLGKTLSAAGRVKDALAAYNAAKATDGNGYYAIRADDIITSRALFASPAGLNMPSDPDGGRADAGQWLVQRFGLQTSTPLANGLRADIAADPRIARGRELWDLGILEDARGDFESVRQQFQDDPLVMYQMSIYFRDIGLYRSSVLAAGRVLQLAGIDPLKAPVFVARLRYPTYFSDLVTQDADKYRLDSLLVFSVIWQESVFEGFATSTASAQGLMQIWPPTGDDIAAKLSWPNYTPSDLQRPVVSVAFGTWLLQDELKRFNNDTYGALAAYNAGTSRAADWQSAAKGDPDLYVELVPVAETRNYIRMIYTHYAVYRTLYASH